MEGQEYIPLKISHAKSKKRKATSKHHQCTICKEKEIIETYENFDDLAKHLVLHDIHRCTKCNRFWYDIDQHAIIHVNADLKKAQREELKNAIRVSKTRNDTNKNKNTEDQDKNQNQSLPVQVQVKNESDSGTSNNSLIQSEDIAMNTLELEIDSIAGEF